MDSPVSVTEQNFAELPKNAESNDSNDNSRDDKMNDSYEWPALDNSEFIGDKQSVDANILVEDAFPDSCYLCTYVPKCQDEFAAHTLESHGKRCLYCECSYATTTDELLDEHRNKHGHFICLECDFQSNTNAILKNHMKNKHADVNTVGTLLGLLRETSSRRRSNENEGIRKRMRINDSVREASVDDMFDSHDESDERDMSFENEEGSENSSVGCLEQIGDKTKNKESQNEDDEREANKRKNVDENPVIETINLKEFKKDLDAN